VTQLPSDLAWQDAYTARFGAPPPDFTDLYYDATNLLLDDVQRVSRIDSRGNLIVSRAVLSRAVRSAAGYQGVSCTITLDPQTGDRLDEPDALSGCAGGG